MALEDCRARGPRLSETLGSSQIAPPLRASRSSLKYAPYDPPEIIPRLRTKRPSSSQSSHSGPSDPGHASLHAPVASLPMTAGDLALTAGLQKLAIIPSVSLNLLDCPQKHSHTSFIATPFFRRRSSRFGTVGFTGGTTFYDLISLLFNTLQAESCGPNHVRFAG